MLNRCTTCTRMSILSQASQTVVFSVPSSFFSSLSFFFKLRSFSASLAYRVGCNHLHSSVSQTTRLRNPQPPSTDCNNHFCIPSRFFFLFLSRYISFFLHFAVCLSLLSFYSISYIYIYIFFFLSFFTRVHVTLFHLSS